MARYPLSIREQQGQPIRCGGREIIPIAQTVSLAGRLPMFSGGLVWNRPAAILERTADGERRIPMPDPTLWATAALLALAALFLARAGHRQHTNSQG